MIETEKLDDMLGTERILIDGIAKYEGKIIKRSFFQPIGRDEYLTFYGDHYFLRTENQGEIKLNPPQLVLKDRGRVLKQDN